ncbi:hypothetical protein KY345_04120 [Candidatus Woesearchaeota archaeon]|nr:hypothetical protein [Candidatus Woesearchaeota archaeon]
MKTNYRFAEFIVQLNYEKENDLASYMKDVIFSSFEKAKDTESHDCSVEIVSEFKIPQKAVRIRAWENELIFEKDREIFFFSPNQALISIDPINKKIKIESKEGSIKPLLHKAIEYLFAGAALEKGMVYLNAYTLSYKGKTIVLAGNPDFARRYCFSIMLSEGAEMVSSDTFIASASYIYPLPVKTSIVENNTRFDSIPMRNLASLNIPKAQHKVHLKQIDTILFIEEWNDEESECKEINIDQAVRNLIRINREYEGYFSEQDFLHMERNYTDKLKGAKFYTFHVGSKEEEAKKKLMQIFD